MARRRAVILKPKTWQILARIIRDYLAGRLTNRPEFEEPRRGRGGRFSCNALRRFTGYDASQWQAIVHEPETYPGADDGACYWANIDPCDTDPDPYA